MQRRLSHLHESLPFRKVYDKLIGLVPPDCPAIGYTDFEWFLNLFVAIFSQARQEETTFVTGSKEFQAILKRD